MSVPDTIPFLDLVAPHVELEQELTSVFRRALFTAGFVGGPMVEDFEKAFAAFSESDHAVAVNSGTDALRFALMACGVVAGDVVVTVPNTFIATAEAISQAGATPEFVDIDGATYNLSVEKLARFFEEECSLDDSGRLVSNRHARPIKAIVPVHLYGQMADMDAILALANRYGLKVIEDACQAHGAEYDSQTLGRWVPAGSIGHAAAFSFYPGKNLGACGEAGAVTTNSEEVAAHVRMLRDHGQSKKYYHEIEGYNGRMDAIQAGVLHVKLPHLKKWTAERRQRAAEYDRLFSGNDGVVCPYEPNWSRAVYHLYVIRVQDRDGLMHHLKEAGIGAGIHYPVPLHLQKAYKAFGYKADDFPVATRLGGEILSLPMFPQLTAQQQSRVASEVLRFVQRAPITNKAEAIDSLEAAVKE